MLRIAVYYIQRWNIERFHYVMKGGCQIEKIQQRSVAKITTVLLTVFDYLNEDIEPDVPRAYFTRFAVQYHFRGG